MRRRSSGGESPRPDREIEVVKDSARGGLVKDPGPGYSGAAMGEHSGQEERPKAGVPGGKYEKKQKRSRA